MADLHRKVRSLRFPPLLAGLGLLCLSLALHSCAKPAASVSEPKTLELPKNARLFRAPYEKVWDVVINTLRLKHLYPITVEDPERGVFSTDFIYAENQTGRRYRLSGSVVKSEPGQVVTLYRHEQVFVQEKWKAVLTDYRLEEFLLNDLESQLN